MLQRLLFFSVFFISTALWAADFGSPDFTHYDLEGDYRVTCINQGLTEVKLHRCSGYMLEPNSWNYFYHNTQSSATRVELSRINNKGRKITKRSDWDSVQKRSTKRINLWVRTLFQRPLLDLGQNTVDYVLLKGDQEVESGQFQVDVFDGGVRTCPWLNETHSDDSLCRSITQACTRFFEIQKNCQ